MLASFVIVVREGLEIALVLAIILGFLEKSGAGHMKSAVWRGVGLTALACVVLTLMIVAAVDRLDEATIALAEGITLILAGFVLSWMVVWMHEHAKDLAGQMRTALADRVHDARALTLFGGRGP